MQVENLTDTSSESETEPLEIDDKTLLEIETLNKTIIEYPYDYESYIKLITTCSKYKKNVEIYKKLNQCRNNMQKMFPLTETLWIDWISDIENESNNDNADPEIDETIKKLYELSIKDYISVKIWCKYYQYLIGRDTSFEIIEKILDRALLSAGFNVNDGNTLWKLYREYEFTILSNFDKDTECYKKHYKKISSLFIRQLSIPSIHLNQVTEEAKNWFNESELSEILTSNQHEIVLKSWNEMEKFENLLKSLDNSSKIVETFQNYIDSIINKNLWAFDPSVIFSVFERFVTLCCLDENAWIKYIKFIVEYVKDYSRAHDVSVRASRNCYWSNKILLYQLLFWEHSVAIDYEAVCDKFILASTSARDYVNLHIELISILFRSETKKNSDITFYFEKSLQLLTVNYPHEKGSYLRFLQFWLNWEEFECKNMLTSRKIWEKIITCGTSKQGEIWCEYIKFEWRNGTKDSCRKVQKMALNSNPDNFHKIAHLCLSYERIHGEHEDYLNLHEKIDKVNERDKVYGAHKHGEKRKFNFIVKKKFEPKKQKTYLPNINVAQNVKVQKKAQPKLDKMIDNDGFAVPNKRIEPTKTSDYSDNPNLTLFLSNIAYNVEEAQIRKALEKCKGITSVQIVRDNFTLKSKGFGYLKFESNEYKEAALKYDRTPVGGRPLYVSLLKEDKTKPNSFKYSTIKEDNKVFIKYLPPDMTSSKLEELFSKFGDILNVRLITFKDGQSKGIAYIDFKTSEFANKAVENMNGKEIENKQLFVAISDPPAKSLQKKTPILNIKKSFVECVNKSKETGMHLRIKPRSIQIKQPPENFKAKSNDEFRKYIKN
ncbi:hypothetical protein A3Q56_01731 [Intoshia linei]|uniref:RRM domain-containing protein n=1 Tax=Intoshia linei TaxID=1819745 RepID=A0A177B892_9BILA|nr:hypothetical protein A3Q56_01731 [Intoshia linei]